MQELRRVDLKAEFVQSVLSRGSYSPQSLACGRLGEAQVKIQPVISSLLSLQLLIVEILQIVRLGDDGP